MQNSDIYLDLFGKAYGSENARGFSPTELEFNQVTKHFATRLVFLTDHPINERHPKEQVLIGKAKVVLNPKKFGTGDKLKASVYAALVWYLEEKEIIRTGPFNESLHASASLQDIDNEKLKSFVRLAKQICPDRKGTSKGTRWYPINK